jgi:pyruvate/2-oxoglutarate/acetoin dehydrogenase E1 component
MWYTRCIILWYSFCRFNRKIILFSLTLREGDDVTIVAIGRMVHMALEAAARLAQEGVECEIVDPRTISPLDEDTILESVQKTGRLVVVDEASPRCNLATDISAMVAQKGFEFLRAPIQMVTPPHTPVPFSDVLEDMYVPDTGRVIASVPNSLQTLNGTPYPRANDAQMGPVHEKGADCGLAR